MKFTSAITNGLLSLWSLGTQNAPVVKSTTSEAQITIQGVLHDFSHQDLTIISESAIGAYNSVYQKDGYSLDFINPQLHFGISDSAGCDGCNDSKLLIADVGSTCDGCDDSMMPTGEVHATCDGCEEESAPIVKVTCDGCSDDELALESTCDGCEGDHSAFVAEFCNRLTESGSSNLANAHHCSFSFVGQTAHKIASLDVTRNADDSAQAFLSVDGLFHDLNQRDIAIIEKSVVETFNDAFAASGDLLMSFKTRVSLDSDSMCDGCARSACDGCERATCDGCAAEAPEGKVFLADVQVGSTCDGCDPALQVLADIQVSSACDGCNDDLKYATSAMSKALCAKLRNSGSFNLAYASECALKFLVDHQVAMQQY